MEQGRYFADILQIKVSRYAWRSSRTCTLSARSLGQRDEGCMVERDCYASQWLLTPVASTTGPCNSLHILASHVIFRTGIRPLLFLLSRHVCSMLFFVWVYSCNLTLFSSPVDRIVFLKNGLWLPSSIGHGTHKQPWARFYKDKTESL